MLSRTRLALIALVGAGLLVITAQGAGLTDSLQKGTADVKSAGPLAFGPEGVLFLGDPQGAAIFAIDTGDRTPAPAGPFKVQGVDEKIAAMLGTSPKEILVKDLAVNPDSGNAYLAVSRGRAPDAPGVIVRVDRQGKVSELSLKDVKFAKTTLPNPPTAGQQRTMAITDVAYVNGKVYVAGLSNEEFSSNLRVIPFPFTSANAGTSVEIFHGNHGKLETKSPIRTFAPYKIKGEDHLLAAYTCTPLVKFPVAQLKPGEKVRGVTVAELGNRNNPLDMFVYQKGGKDFILMANNARGVMKITTEGIDSQKPITERVKEEKSGQSYESLTALKGVEHLDKLDKENALLLVRTSSGSLNLESIPLP